MINRFSQPAQLDPNIALFTPNFEAIGQVLGEYQQAYDETDLLARQAPEHRVSDADSVSQYVQKNMDQIDQVSDFFVKGNPLEGRRQLNALKGKLMQQWMPGGEAYAYRDNFQRSEKFLEQLNVLEMNQAITPDRAKYFRDQASKFSTQYNAGTYNRFDPVAVPANIKDKLQRGLQVGDEVVATWVGEDFRYDPIIGSYIKGTEIRSPEKLSSVVKEAYLQSTDIVADLRQEAIEQGLNPDTYITEQINAMTDEVVRAKMYQKTSLRPFGGSPDDGSGRGGKQIKPEENPLLNVFTTTTVYGTSPYLDLEESTDDAFQKLITEKQREVSTLRTKIETDINARVAEIHPNIPKAITIANNDSGLPELVISKELSNVYTKEQIANLEKEYLPKVVELQRVTTQHKAYEDLRNNYITNYSLDPTKLADIEAYRKKRLFENDTKIQSMSNPGSQISLYTPEQVKEKTEKDVLEYIKKVSPTAHKAYESYYKQLDYLRERVVNQTKGFFLQSTSGDPKVKNAYDSLNTLVGAAIQSGNSGGHMQYSISGQAVGAADAEEIRIAYTKAKEDNDNGDPSDIEYVVRYDNEVGGFVVDVTIPGLNLKDRTTKTEGEVTPVEIYLGPSSNLTSIMINNGLASSYQLGLLTNLEDQFRRTGGLSAELADGDVSLKVKSKYIEEEGTARRKFEVEYAGIIIEKDSDVEVVNTYQNLSIARNYLARGDRASMLSVIEGMGLQDDPEISRILNSQISSQTDNLLRSASINAVLKQSGFSDAQRAILYEKVSSGMEEYPIPDATYTYNNRPITRENLFALINTGAFDENFLKIDGEEDTELKEYIANTKGAIPLRDVNERITNSKGSVSSYVKNPVVNKDFFDKFETLVSTAAKGYNLFDYKITGATRTPSQAISMSRKENSTAIPHTKHKTGNALDLSATKNTETGIAKVLGVSVLEIDKVYNYNGLRILKHRNYDNDGYHIHIESEN